MSKVRLDICNPQQRRKSAPLGTTCVARLEVDVPVLKLQIQQDDPYAHENDCDDSNFGRLLNDSEEQQPRNRGGNDPLPRFHLGSELVHRSNPAIDVHDK